jgi:hypothetical protein
LLISAKAVPDENRRFIREIKGIINKNEEKFAVGADIYLAARNVVSCLKAQRRKKI